MQRRLLNYLVCPVCRASLKATLWVEEGPEIKQGLLSCPAGHFYPVIKGIARFVPDVFNEYPQFLLDHTDELKPFLSSAGGSFYGDLQFKRWHGKTKKSFGREWTRFDVQRPAEDSQSFLAKTGFSLSELSGKLVLDAGCGGGRYTSVAAQAGAEVLAVDLSQAVDKTQQLTVSFPNVHLLQADLMNLPLRSECVDYIYSIGVLHHTPDTNRAFQSLLPLLKPRGKIAIWLYPKWHPIKELINSLQRAVTTRLPHSLLHSLCYLAIPLGAVKRKLLTQKSWPLQRLGVVLHLVTIGVSNHPDPQIRVCDTFDWYSPAYQWHHTFAEVKQWFVEAGLVNILNLTTSQRLYYERLGVGINVQGQKP